jgi:hypothetical protein
MNINTINNVCCYIDDERGGTIIDNNQQQGCNNTEEANPNASASSTLEEFMGKVVKNHSNVPNFPSVINTLMSELEAESSKEKNRDYGLRVLRTLNYSMYKSCFAPLLIELNMETLIPDWRLKFGKLTEGNVDSINFSKESNRTAAIELVVTLLLKHHFISQ